MSDSQKYTCDEILSLGIKQLGLDVSFSAQKLLISYIDLLLKWNKTYNLTAITDRKKIAVQHILDSLAIIPYIKGAKILDVGSGAGLPGIPLAIALPGKNFTLLDCNSKKTRFLTYVMATFQIQNIEIKHRRVEGYHQQIRFDTIVTRAFASLDKIVVSTCHLFNPGGVLLAQKGRYPADEISHINKRVTVYNIMVPFLDAERHLVEIQF